MRKEPSFWEMSLWNKCVTILETVVYVFLIWLFLVLYIGLFCE